MDPSKLPKEILQAIEEWFMTKKDDTSNVEEEASNVDDPSCSNPSGSATDERVETVESEPPSSEQSGKLVKVGDGSESEPPAARGQKGSSSDTPQKDDSRGKAKHSKGGRQDKSQSSKVEDHGSRRVTRSQDSRSSESRHSRQTAEPQSDSQESKMARSADRQKRVEQQQIQEEIQELEEQALESEKMEKARQDSESRRKKRESEAKQKSEVCAGETRRRPEQNDHDGDVEYVATSEISKKKGIGRGAAKLSDCEDSSRLGAAARNSDRDGPTLTPLPVMISPIVDSHPRVVEEPPQRGPKGEKIYLPEINMVTTTMPPGHKTVQRPAASTSTGKSTNAAPLDATKSSGTGKQSDAQPTPVASHQVSGVGGEQPRVITIQNLMNPELVTLTKETNKILREFLPMFERMAAALEASNDARAQRDQKDEAAYETATSQRTDRSRSPHHSDSGEQQRRYDEYQGDGQRSRDRDGGRSYERDDRYYDRRRPRR